MSGNAWSTTAVILMKGTHFDISTTNFYTLLILVSTASTGVTYEQLNSGGH